MSETYADAVNAVGVTFQYGVSDSSSATPFEDDAINVIWPRAIEYAEQRIYREIDFVETTQFVQAVLSANNRYVTIPGNTIVLESMNVITPVGYTPDQLGAIRHPLYRISVEAMNTFCAAATTPDASGLPSYYTVKDDVLAMVGPPADNSYGVEFVGTFRPNQLSSTNTTTLLTTYCPDFFNAALFVYFAGFQRDYDNGGGGVATYEAMYQSLKQSVNVEEWRKGGYGPAWQPFSPTPLATNPRT